MRLFLRSFVDEELEEKIMLVCHKNYQNGDEEGQLRIRKHGGRRRCRGGKVVKAETIQCSEKIHLKPNFEIGTEMLFEET